MFEGEREAGGGWEEAEGWVAFEAWGRGEGGRDWGVRAHSHVSDVGDDPVAHVAVERRCAREHVLKQEGREK